ncbi:MAG: ABC transporter ATP-binding protein [Oscillospiraceae bacterium]
MKLMMRYIWRYKKYLLLSLLGVAGFVAIQMGVPTLLKHIINDALLGENPQVLWQIVIAMFVIMVLGVGGEICMSYANSRIASNVIRDLRNDMFIKTQSFSHSEFDQFSVSSLITSTTSDAYQIMIFIQSLLRSALITPIMTVSGFIMIVNTNPGMFWYVLAALPLLIMGVVIISKKSKPYSTAQQTTLDKINLIMREGLTGLRVIRAFGNESHQDNRFNEVNQEYCGVSKKVYRIMATAQPGFYLLFNFMIVIILWIGSGEIGLGRLDVGTLNASIEYIFHILFSFMMMAVLFTMYPRASVSANRIERVLNSIPSIPENLEKGVTETEEKGYVTFENVTFAYPGETEEPVVKNVSFTAAPGQTVAFIGSTGSGKSTLIQLIPRMYDLTEGRILVDGVDVRDYNIHSLRGKISFIPQKAQLFTGTIAENMRLGKRDATQEELVRAADIAQASDFIAGKENGFEEMLAEGGSNLSGGQKQRLAIARGVVKNPEIYVFDDSFSALDYATDLALRTRLKKEIKEATILIVAQRIGTIRHADKILVLDEGRVVGEGTHEELMDNCGVYYDIAVSQLSQEELG